MRTDIDHDRAKHRPKSARSPVTAADIARVKRALREAGGRATVAAAALSVDPRTLRRWLASNAELRELANDLRDEGGIRGPRPEPKKG